MAIKRIVVSCTEIEDTPGSLHKLLTQIAAADVDLVCAAAFSTGQGQGQVCLSAKEPLALKTCAEKVNLQLKPATGFIITEPDAVGAAAAVLKPLADAGINSLAGTAMICDGQYHMLIVVAASDGDAAAEALGM